MSDVTRMEEQRQARIRAGMRAIEKAFGKHNVASEPLGSFVPTRGPGDLYKLSGRPVLLSKNTFVPQQYLRAFNTLKDMGRIQGTMGSQAEWDAATRGFAPAAMPEVNALRNWWFGKIRGAQDKLFTKVTPVEGFNDEWYDKQRQNFEDIQTAKFDEEYNKLLGNVTYSLSNRGMLDSTAGSRMLTDLQGIQRPEKLAQIANNSTAYANSLRKSVADQKNVLKSQLLASADPESTGIAAYQAAQTLSYPSTPQAVEGMLSNWAASYLTNPYASQQQGGTPIRSPASYNIPTPKVVNTQE